MIHDIDQAEVSGDVGSVEAAQFASPRAAVQRRVVQHAQRIIGDAVEELPVLLRCPTP